MIQMSKFKPLDYNAHKIVSIMRPCGETVIKNDSSNVDRKSTRLNSSPCNLVCRLLLEKKKNIEGKIISTTPPQLEPPKCNHITIATNNTTYRGRHGMITYNTLYTKGKT